MADLPQPVAAFLAGNRYAVAGVSRSGDTAANAVLRKLLGSGYEAFPVNPNASEVEGVRCFPEVGAVPGPLDGVVVGTHPDVSAEIVRQSLEAGVPRIWLHRSFGAGSVSDDAVAMCRTAGVDCIVGGCPLMFCEPVDLAHKCMRWWLQRSGRAPR